MHIVRFHCTCEIRKLARDKKGKRSSASLISTLMLGALHARERHAQSGSITSTIMLVAT